jgi:transposase
LCRNADPVTDALDHEALKALICTQHEQLLSQAEELLSKNEQLVSREVEIEHLKLLIAKLRRMRFGRSSEKLDRKIDQLELRLEELQASQPESKTVAPNSPEISPVTRPVRRPLPDHLPRETRKYPPKQEACLDCGGELKHLGEDVSEILEYVPERFKVIRQVRPKSACARSERIVQAPAPSRPIERSFAGRHMFLTWFKSGRQFLQSMCAA